LRALAVVVAMKRQKEERMRWIFAVVGLVAGSAMAPLLGASNPSGAIVGALIGFMLGVWLGGKSSTQGPANAGAESGLDGSPTLIARVEQLERQVAALTQELARLHAPEAKPAQAPEVAQPLPADPLGLSTSAAQSVAPAEPASPSSSDSARGAGPDSAAMPARTQEARAEQTFPPEPLAPNLFERAVRAARDWLVGGNTVVRVGMVVLFFGVAFLLKYAADNAMLPIEFRLAGVALGAIVLLVVGWRIGSRRGAYGLVLQGGGIGVLYLTVFAATRLYALLPTSAAFPLMVVICALGAFLAVRQDAPALAFLSSAGGFLAPVLISTGGGSHIALFTYYALLDAGIFAIAWFKAWRPLNLLGFTFTFAIGTAWGVTSYRPEWLASTEPFLILFFLMFVGIALLYAMRRELAIKHYVDGTLVFGTPIVALGLQAALMRHIPFGLAWSAVALAAFYLLVAAWLARRRERLALLFQSAVAIGIMFATLAIPLAFSGPTTSAAWAIEGAALAWLGVRQRRYLPLGFGLLMQLAAAGAFFVSQLFASAPSTPVLNSAYLATLLIAAGGVFTGWQLHGREQGRTWRPWIGQLGLAAAVWGLLWWIGGGADQIAAYAQTHAVAAPTRFTIDASILFAVLTAWLAHALRRVLAWPAARWPALALAPVLAWLSLAALGLNEAPLTGLGAIAWPAAFVLGYLLLWREERDAPGWTASALHTVMFWVLCCVLAQQAYWRLRAYVPEGAWSWSAWAYGLGITVLLVSTVGTRLRWPVGRFARAYQLWAAGPLAALLWLWTFASLQSDGSAAPLPWLPLVNPLDVAQMLVFVAMAAWLQRAATFGFALPSRLFAYATLATGFLWLNAVLLRALHHWVGLPYDLGDMARSTLAQACVSILWTLCALALTVWATRKGARAVWFVAAGLLGLTVLKLFVFDLSHVQGLERIVSFIGIGVMLLLIGYFSPLPPKASEHETTTGGNVT
jgi:uncharacterized membrane protein